MPRYMTRSACGRLALNVECSSFDRLHHQFSCDRFCGKIGGSANKVKLRPLPPLRRGVAVLLQVNMVSSNNITGMWGPVTATLDWCEVS